LKAGEKWRSNDYLSASDAIAKAIVAHNVISYAGYKVMLPGANGFNLNSNINLNPSYFVFPAWRDLGNRSHLMVWKDLINDGQKLLGKMRFGNGQLPADWVSLYADGRMTPARQWPARFSYDAIRVPLYVKWYAPQSPLLEPYKAFWGQYSRNQTPAYQRSRSVYDGRRHSGGTRFRAGATAERRTANHRSGRLLLRQPENAGQPGGALTATLRLASKRSAVIP